jgi:hypothetical protein
MINHLWTGFEYMPTRVIISEGSGVTYYFKDIMNAERYFEPWYASERYVAVDEDGFFLKMMPEKGRVSFVKGERDASSVRVLKDLLKNTLLILIDANSLYINKSDIDSLEVSEMLDLLEPYALDNL